jgi:hypothetical protein
LHAGFHVCLLPDLKTEATFSSETPVDYQRSTLGHIPEDRLLKSDILQQEAKRRESLLLISRAATPILLERYFSRTKTLQVDEAAVNSQRHDVCLLDILQTDTGVHPASYPMGARGGSFRKV